MTDWARMRVGGGSVSSLHCACLAFLVASAAAGESLSVAVGRQFFNPSIGQTIDITIGTGSKGPLVVEVLDRDRVLVRALHTVESKGSPVLARWDGKDQDGRVVPDEAYFVRVRGSRADGPVLYDLSAGFESKKLDASAISYSRQEGVLSYRLPAPARVHVQVGQAIPGKSGEPNRGPVLRTLSDRRPRPAGAVIDLWNGRDDSGLVEIASLPHFAVSILAMSLPPASILTSGNRGLSFEDYVLARRGQRLQPRAMAPGVHAHHKGLHSLEDRSPQLELKQVDSSPAVTTWRIEEGQTLQLQARLVGSTVPFFLSQPTTLYVFVDANRVASIRCPQPSCPVEVVVPKVAPGVHFIAANWVSDFGPVAVAVQPLEILQSGSEGR